MKQRTLHPFLQKVAALAILGIGLGAAVSALAYPLAGAFAQRSEAEARLARYTELASSPPTATAAYNPADLAAVHIDTAEAQLALQAVVDRLARGAGLAVQSTQPLAAEHMGDVGQGVWIDLTASSDLQALIAFLASFDAERPLLMVRRLEVEAGAGPRPDVFLRFKAQIGRVWRTAEASQ
jgi:hypothetical protein